MLVDATGGRAYHWTRGGAAGGAARSREDVMSGRRIGTLAAAALAVAGAALGPGTAGAAAPEVVLEVKFQDTLEVRGADERLHSAAGESLDRVEPVLQRHRAQEIEPLVQSMTPAQLDGLAAEARTRTGRPAPDMASWYHVTLPAGADAAAAAADLRALPEVVHAYPAPG
jgi:hypothetical protein